MGENQPDLGHFYNTVVSLIVHGLYYYFIAPDQIFASDLLLRYTIAQTLVNSFVFDVVVYMICHRFRAINGVIRQLNEKLAAYWIALKIRKIRRLHDGTYTECWNLFWRINSE